MDENVEIGGKKKLANTHGTMQIGRKLNVHNFKI